jgi:hypothetical protein
MVAQISSKIKIYVPLPQMDVSKHSKYRAQKELIFEKYEALS